jgi:hypothetical protein
MPRLIRVNPASLRRARLSGVTDSGLASVVTSTSGATGNSSRTAARTAARSSAGSRVGVPPPTNTVDTVGGSGPSTAAAARSSLIAVAAYSARLAPGPSSSAV